MPHASFTLPLGFAKEMARALHPHASADKVTPILCGAYLGGDFGQHAYATDRYSIGRFDVSGFEDVPGSVLWIPRAALTMLNGVGKSHLPFGTEADHDVTFSTLASESHTYAEVMITDRPSGLNVFARTFGMHGANGNPPPVHRLFADFEPGHTRPALGGNMIDRVSSYAMRYRKLVRITTPENKNDRKFAPVLFEVGDRFKALIQPNLAKDTTFGPELYQPEEEGE